MVSIKLGNHTNWSYFSATLHFLCLFIRAFYSERFVQLGIHIFTVHCEVFIPNTRLEKRHTYIHSQQPWSCFEKSIFQIQNQIIYLYEAECKLVCLPNIFCHSFPFILFLSHFVDMVDMRDIVDLADIGDNMLEMFNYLASTWPQLRLY